MESKTSEEYTIVKKQLYKVHSYMMTRCYNKKHKQYNKYGGRGICVCSEWKGKNGFSNFYNWAIKNGFDGKKDGKGYNVLSIDRINNDKGYSPNNCRWATREEQANNKSTTIWVEYKGEKNTLKHFCRELGLNYHAVFLRIYRRKWSVEKALSTPIQKDYEIFYDNKKHNLQSLSNELGICRSSLEYQIRKKNKTYEEAIQHCLKLKGV